MKFGSDDSKMTVVFSCEILDNDLKNYSMNDGHFFSQSLAIMLISSMTIYRSDSCFWNFIEIVC